MSEVGHFVRYGDETRDGGVRAVIDTILNRVAHRDFPDSINDVVNARDQFSAIGGPGGVGCWKRLPPASTVLEKITAQHLRDRLDGRASTIKGATHFLNPYYSSPRALSAWGNHVVKNSIASWGRGRDIHFHGYAPGYGPPPDYTLAYDGRTRTCSGHGIRKSVATAKRRGPLSNIVDVADAQLPTFGAKDLDDDAATLAYRVVSLPNADISFLEPNLNQFSAEGWRLRQLIPLVDRLLIVLEGEDLDLKAYEVDERVENSPPNLSGNAAIEIDRPGAPLILKNYQEKFSKFISKLGLVYFKYNECLVLGGQHFAGPAEGKNAYPPEELWEHIVPTARVIDELRRRLGSEINISSAYRSPAYNALIPGAAGGGMHMQFRAIDFSCADCRGAVWWAEQLRALRDEGMFKGGIGVYPTFVHLDTRGDNVNFGPWRQRVFG
jgi:hypothetical protein